MPAYIRFTKSAIEKLPTPDGKSRSTYYDQDVKKLALRITSAGTKSFYIVKRVDREMIWLKLGTFPDMTVEQARKGAQIVLGKFAGHENPAEARRAAKSIPTLAEFFKEYGERHGRKKLSWESDQQRFRDYVKGPLGNRKISHITRDMISRVLSNMDAKEMANATINNVRALISGLFGKAIEWGYVSDNPVKGIKTRKAVKRDRFMSGNELSRFFTSVAMEPNTTLRDYFLIALLTGARRANVLEMKWSDINFDDGIWRIEKTKNGDPQNVTLSPEAIGILEQRKKENAQSKSKSIFVFPGPGKSGHLVEPKKGWKRIFDRDEIIQLEKMINETNGELFPNMSEQMRDVLLKDAHESTLIDARLVAKKAGIDVSLTRIQDLRIHDLRRTLGSWQAKSGASLAIIGKSLNHKSQLTTAIYARLDLDPVRESVNTATTAMLEAAGLSTTSKVITK